MRVFVSKTRGVYRPTAGQSKFVGNSEADAIFHATFKSANFLDGNILHPTPRMKKTHQLKHPLEKKSQHQT